MKQVLQSEKYITRKELLALLLSQISSEELCDLKAGAGGYIISKYNRQTILRMAECESRAEDSSDCCEESRPVEIAANREVFDNPRQEFRGSREEQERSAFIESEKVLSLINLLENFLNQYMADQPAGHKWIILCCIYLSFVVHEPMHPQEIVHWKQDEAGHYYCPAYSSEDDATCKYCVCEGLLEQ